MTNKSHHPSSDLMLSYSAGTASASHALCVATHLEFCASCRKIHQRNNAIGGKLIDDFGATKDVSVDDSIKLNVLNRLDSVDLNAEPNTLAADNNPPSSIPKVLKKLIPDGFSDLSWTMVSATARSCQLFKDDSGVTVGLLKLKPGGRIAKHKHLGDEFTIVLTGSFSDEEGVYKAGDFLHCDTSVSHSPVATKDAECICLTLQEAPLQFTGPLFKLFNPLIRSQFQAS